MKNSLFFFCFISQYLFSSSHEVFNKGCDLITKKKYDDAIKLLESSIKTLDLNQEMLYKYYYQLGTLYCIKKEYKHCIDILKKSYEINSNNKKTIRNIELAYRMLKNKSKNKNERNNKNTKKNNENQAQKSFSKKFSNQLKSLKYSEKDALKKKFGRKINASKKRFKKDW